MKKILHFLPVVIFIVVFSVIMGFLFEQDRFYKLILLLCLLPSILLFKTFTKILIRENMGRSQWILRFVASLVFVLIAMATNIVLFIQVKGKSFNEIWGKEYFIPYFLVPTILSLMLILVYFVSNYYKEFYDSKSKKQELVIQKISSQYEGLQQQLSPHFLFNSLNVLDSLIEENSKSAQEFTRELSQIYRYVLEQQPKDFTTIGEELEFVKNYVNLMSKRFEGAVEYTVSKDIQVDNKVFPLSIQLLIENAFKHNGLSEINPLKIEISQEGEYLVVKNNLIPKKNTKSTSQKGLANIEARYQKLGLNTIIEKTENKFTVKLPIINKNVITMEYTIEQREQVEKRVKELRKFYKKLTSYVITVLICTAVNLITSWSGIFTDQGINFRLLWVIWVIVPWGFTLLGRAIMLFWLPSSKFDWEGRKTQEFLEKGNISNYN